MHAIFVFKHLDSPGYLTQVSQFFELQIREFIVEILPKIENILTRCSVTYVDSLSFK